VGGAWLSCVCQLNLSLWLCIGFPSPLAGVGRMCRGPAVGRGRARGGQCGR
jgi:hypothetical protein